MLKDSHSQKSKPVSLSIAVVVISDTRDDEGDRSGAILAKRIVDAGHDFVEKACVKDTHQEITALLKSWISREDIHVIVGTGGTGLSPRDVSPEAFRSVYEKEMEGFSHMVHRVSYETIGLSTMQARPTAGIAHGKVLFSLPGSPGACRDIWDGVLKPILHSNHRPCNMIEVIEAWQSHLHPRL